LNHSIKSQKSRSFLEHRESRDSIKRNDHNDLYNYLHKFKKKEDHTIISIVIPVYNEEKTIRKIIEHLPRDGAIEIIIVDDHSSDNSLEEIKKAKSSIDLRVISHKKNKGYGRTLLTGVHECKGDIFLTLDSDGQHQPEDIFNLVKPIFENEADITIGSRYKGTYSYELPLATRFGEAILEVMINLLFGQSVKNNQGGFRAFHRKTFLLFETAQFHGYAFTTELILAAAIYGYKIKECPIHLLEREHGSSYINLNKLMYSLLLCIGLYFFKKIKRLLFKEKRS